MEAGGQVASKWIAGAAVCVAVLAATPAGAEVVLASDVQVLNSYTATNKYLATGAAGPQTVFEFGGVNEISIASRPGTFLELCLEFFVPGGGAPRNLNDGWGGSLLDAGQQATAQALLSNTVSTFYGMRDAYVANGGDTNAANADAGERLQGYGGAMQAALWEIIMDTDLSTTIAGAFGIYHGRYAPGMASNYQTLYTDEFLGHLADGSWTDQGGLRYVFADSGDDQDHILVQTDPGKVPEPASALLLGVGLLAMRSVRRQRAASQA